MYIHGVQPDAQLSHELVNELKEEINVFFTESLSRSSISDAPLEITPLKNFFHNHLGLSNNESVLKVSIFHPIILVEKVKAFIVTDKIFLSVSADNENAGHFSEYKWGKNTINSCSYR